MKRNLIWCEVSCRRCQATAHFSGWYLPERIKKLKLETKAWKEDDDYGILVRTVMNMLHEKGNLVSDKGGEMICGIVQLLKI